MIILFIILIGGYNTLYKYILVKNSLDSFNYNSSTLSPYMSFSNVEVSYLSIFIYSLVISLICFLILSLILKTINKYSFREVLNKLSSYLLIVFTVISGIFLFINELLGLGILFIGILIYLYFMYKRFDKKSIVFIFLTFILMIYLLYFISS